MPPSDPVTETVETDDQNVAAVPDGDTGANLFDAAAPEPVAGADGKAQRPDYLPEQFWDAETGAPRLDALARSWTDMRGKVARGEGVVPATPEAYTLPQVEGVAADLIKADDPLWTDIRQAAHAAQITPKQLEALAKPYLAFVAKAAPQAADPAAQAAADQAHIQAEISKLGPNGRGVVRDLGAWLTGMGTRGVMTDAEVRALKAMGTTADGVRALGKFRELLSEKPIPIDAFGDDEVTQADAERMMQESFAKNDPGLRSKARKALEKLQATGRLAVR